MRFDADAFLSASEPPAFSVGGRTYVGRILSVMEATAIIRRLNTVNETMTDTQVEGEMRDILNQIFPPARKRWFKPAPVDTADVFFAMPRAAQLAAFATFSKSLAQRTLPATGTMMSKTSAATDDSQAAAIHKMRTSESHLSVFRWPPFWRPTEPESGTTQNSGEPAMV